MKPPGQETRSPAVGQSLTPTQNRILDAAEAILKTRTSATRTGPSSPARSCRSPCRTPTRATCRSGSEATAI